MAFTRPGHNQLMRELIDNSANQPSVLLVKRSPPPPVAPKPKVVGHKGLESLVSSHDPDFPLPPDLDVDAGAGEHAKLSPSMEDLPPPPPALSMEVTAEVAGGSSLPPPPPFLQSGATRRPSAASVSSMPLFTVKPFVPSAAIGHRLGPKPFVPTGSSTAAATSDAGAACTVKAPATVDFLPPPLQAVATGSSSISYGGTARAPAAPSAPPAPSGGQHVSLTSAAVTPLPSVTMAPTSPLPVAPPALFTVQPSASVTSAPPPAFVTRPNNMTAPAVISSPSPRNVVTPLPFHVASPPPQPAIIAPPPPPEFAMTPPTLDVSSSPSALHGGNLKMTPAGSVQSSCTAALPFMSSMTVTIGSSAAEKPDAIGTSPGRASWRSSPAVSPVPSSSNVSNARSSPSIMPGTTPPSVRKAETLDSKTSNSGVPLVGFGSRGHAAPLNGGNLNSNASPVKGAGVFFEKRSPAANERPSGPQLSVNALNGRLTVPVNSVDPSKANVEHEAEVDALTDLLIQNMESAKDPSCLGVCAHCNKKIVGDMCTAQEKTYHVACFACSGCGKLLTGQSFYAVRGTPQCETCFVATLEKCHSCHQPITDRILRATGKAYHARCFTCVVCSRSLDGIPFTVDSGDAAHCIEDFHKKYAPRCSVCQLPIMPEPGQEETVRIVALDRNFHVGCYKCEDCSSLLSSDADGRGCYPLNGHVLCKECNARRVFNQTTGGMATGGMATVPATSF